MKYKNELIETPDVMDGAGALAAITRAEVDLQIQTAKTYPRDVDRFKATAMSIVTADEDTAASMFYAMPRGGKSIEGPSVRLAEVVASTWGNMRVQARITSIDEKFVTATAMCHDLESNLAISVDVRRRITSKDGRRFNDDMIVVTSNAACAVAYREAVFKTIPRHFINTLYDESRMVAIGNARTLASRRASMVDYFAKMGVSSDNLCRVVGVASEEHIDLDGLATLKGLATAIKDGTTSVDEAFPVDEASPAAPVADAPPITGDSLFSGEAKVETAPEPPKKKRGRPRKKPVEKEESVAPKSDVAKDALASAVSKVGSDSYDESHCDMDVMVSITDIMDSKTQPAEILQLIEEVIVDDSYSADEKLYIATRGAHRIDKVVLSDATPF